MLDYFVSRTALIFLAGSLAALTVACSGNQQTRKIENNQPSIPTGNLAAIKPPMKKPTELLIRPEPMVEPTVEPMVKPTVEPTVEPLVTPPSALELALDKANDAENMSKSAQSPQDWYLVASRFEYAIAILQDIESDSVNFPFAQSKIAEYEQEAQLAIQRANPSQGYIVDDPPDTVAVNQDIPNNLQPFANPVFTREAKNLPSPEPMFPVAEVATKNHNQVFVAPITRRIGGTPIVEVTFNGSQRFEMIVDTGASGSVITQQMAEALNVVQVATAKANTVSSQGVEFPVGYLQSMEVGGIKLKQIPVAIAGKELQTGLLGHDFFGNYDVTIRRDVVEFRPQTHAEANPLKMRLTPSTSAKDLRFVESPLP